MKNLRSGMISLVLTLFIISGSFAQECPDGMVSYWKLDDLSGDLFEDSYGNHDANAESPVASVEEGKVGAAKDWDGTNVVIVDDHADFNFAVNSSFSIEFWVKYSEIVGDRSNIMIGKNDPYAAGAYWSIGIDNPTGKLFFDLRDGNANSQSIESGSALSTNTWHLITAVRSEATNQNLLYVDGALVGSAVTYDYPGNFSSAGDINIGFLLRLGVPDYFFSGILDEIAIYNRALSSAEITEHVSKNNFGIGVCDGYSPSIISTPTTTAVVGQQYTYTVKATGMPTIQYSLVTSPQNMSINSSTGAITWTPSSIDEDGLVVVRASNTVAPADTQSFRIYLATTPVCPTGILALWKLNETSGPTYVDFYNTHTIESVAPPTATTGKINGGQTFNASTFMDIPDNGDEFEWTQTSNFSFEAWIKTTSSETMVIFGRSRSDFPEASNYWIGLSGGVATFYLHENDTSAAGIFFEISGGAPLNDNLWHHIIAVRNGSSQENRLYVDGLEVASVATDYNNTFIWDEPEPTPINLGWFDNTASGYHFIGTLDEVAIFNKAITDVEATSFFNLGQPAGHCAIDNYAPIITSTPSLEATEDSIYTYTFTIEDYDVSDTIVLSAPTKPDWLNLNFTMGQRTAVLTGTPLNDNAGDNSVILRVDDGTMTKDQSFTINVPAVNDAPVITSEPILDAYVGELYSYVLTATDEENPELTLSAVEKPAWLDFSATNGILSGTPAQEDKGQHLIILRVSDGVKNVDQNFTIEVDGPDGLADLSAAGISIYPVPARDHLTLELGNLSEQTRLEVVSSTGSVLKQVVIPANQNKYRLDLKGIDNGVYYLHLTNSSLNNIGRFVISR